MPTVTIIDDANKETTVTAQVGLSLMETIRENGFDELQAICGGGCACATCHVYIDPAYLDRLPPISGDEEDLLDSVSSRQGNSRLSCQIPITQAVDGVIVTIAPAE